MLKSSELKKKGTKLVCGFGDHEGQTFVVVGQTKTQALVVHEDGQNGAVVLSTQETGAVRTSARPDAWTPVDGLRVGQHVAHTEQGQCGTVALVIPGWAVLVDATVPSAAYAIPFDCGRYGWSKGTKTTKKD